MGGGPSHLHIRGLITRTPYSSRICDFYHFSIDYPKQNKMFCRFDIQSLSSALRTKTILLVKSSLLSLHSWQRHLSQMRWERIWAVKQQHRPGACLHRGLRLEGKSEGVLRNRPKRCQSQTTPYPHPHPLNHPKPSHPTKKNHTHTHTHPPTVHSLCLSRQSLWTEPVGMVTSFSSSVEPAVVVLLPLCGADTSCGRWGMRSPAPPLKVCTQRWENTISIPLGKLCF